MDQNRILVGKLAIVIILFLFIILIFAYNAYMSFGFLSKKAPYIGSFRKHLNIMKEKLKLKKGASLIDLGCGDGKAMRFFSRHFELGQIDGCEVNITALIIGKIKNLIYKSKNINLYRGDFQNANIKEYDYIYIYLLPEQLARIEDWVFAEIGENTVVITNSFRFKKHQAFETIKNKKGKDDIFLYRK